MQSQTLPRTLPTRTTFQIAPALPVVLALVAAAFALILTLRAPPVWTLDIGAPGDTRFITEMLEPERDRATGTTFRWTEPSARLWLPGVEFAPFAPALHIYTEEPQGAKRQLRLEREGRQLGALELAPGWRVYHVLLPGAAGEALDTAPLTLATDPLHNHKDSQARGVPLDWVRLDPLESAAPPWRALLLTWGLAAPAGWLWQLDRLLFKERPGLRGLRVGAFVGVVAAGLVTWARANPYLLAWTIPALPWSLGVATVLLIGVALRPLRARWSSRRTAAVALLVIGQVLLVTHAAVALGAGLALLGLAFLPLSNAPETAAAPPLWLSRRAEWILLILIFLVGLGLRFYRLGELPYGLWRDEGRHGLVALQMLDDPNYRPAYIPGGVDLPGLGLFPFALALRAWGIHIWSMRAITALAGALTVLPLHALVRRLYGRGAIALLAAGLLAISSWSLTLSRFSFPTIFDPLLQLTALWLLVVGLGAEQTDDVQARYIVPPRTTNDEGVRNTHHASRFPFSVFRFPFYAPLFFSGICLGLAAQTYHTGRMGLVVAGLLALLLLRRAPQRWRAWLIGVAALGLGFVLAASPLLNYALRHPEAFNQRVGAVFLLSEESSDKRAPLAKIDESIGRHLLMFNVRGDSNGRHAAPDRPMLDAVTGLALLVGVAALVRRRRDWRSQFLLGALAIGLLPSVLTVDNPHAMRGIGALAFACAIAALGLVELWRIVSGAVLREENRPKEDVGARPSRSVLAVTALTWGLALMLNARTYFVLMPADRAVWTAFYPFHTQIGAYIRALADDQGPDALRQVFVPDRLVSNPVFGYLAHDLPVQTFNAQRLSAAAQSGALFIVPATTLPKELRALIAKNGLAPLPLVAGPTLPDGSGASFLVYRKN
jgi:Dolichyl-phosphate-mannose-protein mannosyltransferase